MPDIQIVVKASQDIIQSGLSEREQLTRFEQGNRTSEGLYFLEREVEILRNFEVETVIIENTTGLCDNASTIEKYRDKHN